MVVSDTRLRGRHNLQASLGEFAMTTDQIPGPENHRTNNIASTTLPCVSLATGAPGCDGFRGYPQGNPANFTTQGWLYVDFDLSAQTPFSESAASVGSASL